MPTKGGVEPFRAQDLFEVPAANPLHGKKRTAGLVDAGVVQRHDVGVFECRRCPDFLHETFGVGRRLVSIGTQFLESDRTAELQVSGLADGAAEQLMLDGEAIDLTNGFGTTTAANGFVVSVSVSGTTATETLDPLTDELLSYLIRVRNACGSTLGEDPVRVGGTCP